MSVVENLRHRMAPPWRRLGPRRLVALLTAVLVLSGLYVVGDTFIEDDNFRVVMPDLYRSGQLRADEWSESLDEHQYRSVLNLRGAASGQDWYERELAFADRHGLVHYDLALSANRAPTFDEMKHLVALMRMAPKPLLIHCKEGADRSGLVAGLYRLAVDHARPEDARGQLSLWYGHFPWLTSRTGAMDRALDAFIMAQTARERSRFAALLPGEGASPWLASPSSGH